MRNFDILTTHGNFQFKNQYRGIIINDTFDKRIHQRLLNPIMVKIYQLKVRS